MHVNGKDNAMKSMLLFLLCRLILADNECFKESLVKHVTKLTVAHQTHHYNFITLLRSIVKCSVFFTTAFKTNLINHGQFICNYCRLGIRNGIQLKPH